MTIHDLQTFSLLQQILSTGSHSHDRRVAADLGRVGQAHFQALLEVVQTESPQRPSSYMFIYISSVYYSIRLYFSSSKSYLFSLRRMSLLYITNCIQFQGKLPLQCSSVWQPSSLQRRYFLCFNNICDRFRIDKEDHYYALSGFALLGL